MEIGWSGIREYVYSLSYPHIFIGKKPAAVLFGEERFDYSSVSVAIRG